MTIKPVSYRVNVRGAGEVPGPRSSKAIAGGAETLPPPSLETRSVLFPERTNPAPPRGAVSRTGFACQPARADDRAAPPPFAPAQPASAARASSHHRSVASSSQTRRLASQSLNRSVAPTRPPDPPAAEAGLRLAGPPRRRPRRLRPPRPGVSEPPRRRLSPRRRAPPHRLGGSGARHGGVRRPGERFPVSRANRDGRGTVRLSAVIPSRGQARPAKLGSDAERLRPRGTGRASAASGLGHYDFGANRARVDALRRRFQSG